MSILLPKYQRKTENRILLLIGGGASAAPLHLSAVVIVRSIIHLAMLVKFSLRNLCVMLVMLLMVTNSHNEQVRSEIN